ncbi:MAG TPA: lipase maturation factor family protein, partial [Thermoanaerobaculia bacterium]|nr:lipase maturation factor family protein [Thermoanaerobaculia bacterium]
VGSHGVLPVARFLDWAHARAGREAYGLLPSLCWLDASDTFLHVLCGGGTLASLLLIGGLAPSLCLVVAWVIYLSLAIAGQVFLEFQWDFLLLEAGFLAILFAPRRWRMRIGFEPSSAVLFLLRWLLFRLMFSSGFVKLASNDPSWRHLTALTFHYETQPLPPWTAWFMHQLPVSFQRFSCLLMFSIELAVPLLIFAPRRLRLLAFGALVTFQLLIAATGNYAFFNLLTLALCVLLVDDAAFPRRFREWAARRAVTGGKWPGWLLAPLAATILLVSLVEFSATLRHSDAWPGLALRLTRAAMPYRSVNTYGLFSVMTTSRPEIVIEGSEDGNLWRAYEFPWKPGDVLGRPRFVAPHQPRLDWQMWFAALGRYQENPWFINFLARLLQGSPEVLRLLEKNPFPDHPPRFVRAVLYDYHFTDADTRRRTGAWWRREPRGLYCPVLSREMLHAAE